MFAAAAMRNPAFVLCRTLLALLLTLGLAGGARAEETDRPTGPEAVDRAIERGVAWLVTEQRRDGSWSGGRLAPGTAALGAYVLAHCGARPDPQGTPAARALARALTHLDALRFPGPKAKGPGVYALSLWALALREIDRPGDRAQIARIATRLAAGQAENGQWHYQARAGSHRPRTGDNSNTQFAILALGAAQAEGIAVPRRCFEQARRWWLASRAEDGGYGYASGGGLSRSTGSMTAAGLASLHILARVLADPVLARLAEGSAARLADGFSAKRNEGMRANTGGGGSAWLHYYLWSVERAMVLGGQERLGEHDWYRLGAQQLIATQGKDGAWRPDHPLYDTCFALLFLSRAADPPTALTPGAGRMLETRQPDAGPRTGGPAETPDAPAQLEQHLDAGRDHRVLWLVRKTGPQLLWRIARRLLVDDAARRTRVLALLGRLLPADRLRGLDRDALARGRLVQWLRRHGPDFVLRDDGRYAPSS